jgi:hypothetical protein
MPVRSFPRRDSRAVITPFMQDLQEEKCSDIGDIRNYKGYQETIQNQKTTGPIGLLEASKGSIEGVVLNMHTHK